MNLTTQVAVAIVLTKLGNICSVKYSVGLAKWCRKIPVILKVKNEKKTAGDMVDLQFNIDNVFSFIEHILLLFHFQGFNFRCGNVIHHINHYFAFCSETVTTNSDLQRGENTFFSE